MSVERRGRNRHTDYTRKIVTREALAEYVADINRLERATKTTDRTHLRVATTSQSRRRKNCAATLIGGRSMSYTV